MLGVGAGAAEREEEAATLSQEESGGRALTILRRGGRGRVLPSCQNALGQVAHKARRQNNPVCGAYTALREPGGTGTPF